MLFQGCMKSRVICLVRPVGTAQHLLLACLSEEDE